MGACQGPTGSTGHCRSAFPPPTQITTCCLTRVRTHSNVSPRHKSPGMTAEAVAPAPICSARKCSAPTPWRRSSTSRPSSPPSSGTPCPSPKYCPLAPNRTRPQPSAHSTLPITWCSNGKGSPTTSTNGQASRRGAAGPLAPTPPSATEPRPATSKSPSSNGNTPSNTQAERPTAQPPRRPRGSSVTRRSTTPTTVPFSQPSHSPTSLPSRCINYSASRSSRTLSNMQASSQPPA